jgi:AcrR family transcriptional regulator
MTEPATMRRTPKQARSQQRVNHILDTAESIFAEAGYEHTTTNAIAAQAGVPIGSLYQFFPSKEAILNALIERYAGEMNALLHDPSLDALPMAEAVNQLVDRLAIYDSTHAGFKMILAASGIADSMHNQIVSHVDEMLARRFPALAVDCRRRGALIAVAIVKGLMQLSGSPESSDSMQSSEMLFEIKTALVAYLRAMLQREGISA